MAKLAIVAYVVCAPLLLDLVDSEFTQAIALWLAALACGFVAGRANPKFSVRRAVLTGTAAGVMSYLVILGYSAAVYDVDLGPQLGVWFLRFAVAGALAIVGGMMLGTRSRSSSLVALLDVVSIAVGIVAS